MRRTCSKCQASMIEGFVVDHKDNGGSVSSWVEGAPVKSWWGGLKLRGRKRIAVETYRCPRCGFLESYAPV